MLIFLRQHYISVLFVTKKIRAYKWEKCFLLLGTLENSNNKLAMSSYSSVALITVKKKWLTNATKVNF